MMLWIDTFSNPKISIVFPQKTSNLGIKVNDLGLILLCYKKKHTQTVVRGKVYGFDFQWVGFLTKVCSSSLNTAANYSKKSPTKLPKLE